MNLAIALSLHLALLLGLFHVTVTSHHHEHHGHSHLHHRSGHKLVDARNSSLSGNNSSSGAEDMVKKALLAAAARNKARFQNPKFNNPELDLDTTNPTLADPLLYSSGNDTLESKRQIVDSNNASDSSTASDGYSIPSELAEAARLVAESHPQVPKGDHEQVAKELLAKYNTGGNDTNTPPHYKTPEGLLSKFGSDIVANVSTLDKRASGYWMLDMPQLGSSPFAPAGYKVFRNVKDYGAKGDGKTDDTAAINKAISDGGRCGPNCGSSTIYPAVVFFPAGTYLISSSLIQYYNTQLLGDPTLPPTILGASSFIGLGMIASDVYVSDKEEWYVNTNNFLRSIRNFVIDLRNTDPTAYICGIHWQVAQGTSIENVVFYMKYNSDTPGNTQQGIYMENGSGGFLADLTFIGGNFGAYMGNQQFTTSHLVFKNCNTAVQIHWDWAWTMHDFVIDSCQNGLNIVGGAGGPGSTGQGVGSLVLVDSKISNTPNGIITTLASENSTSFMLQNVGFFNVQTAVKDSGKGTTMLAGGAKVVVDSWGFGRVNNATGPSKFVAGGPIPVMQRQADLLGAKSDPSMQANLFTRRRPKYETIPSNKVMNVKSLGAKGDGVTDDTAALNSILEGAANTSSIVYFPFGVYAITSTLHVPTGSRIIGQAWSQIMAMGPEFSDEQNVKVAVKFGNKGEKGILEIQDMLFTISAKSGATPGAVIVEWNVQQSSQGAAGMWDSHIRVGGAKGTGLQKEECPKNTGKVNPNCKAAAMLMHLTPNSTAYLENVWAWTADHDMDKVTQGQIDIYTGRGMLIESNLAWLWGTSVEHSVFYQYQLSSASNILLSMIQTESPYFQPVPKAPIPFQPGLFPNDPTFKNCSLLSCYSSWAVRVVDSSAIYILGAGLYSWFSDYKQDCVKTENCQQRGFEVVESYDVWVYNLCTKAIVEMVSPLLTAATLAKDNKNGFLSSVVAWLQGSKTMSGKRQFTGFRIYTPEDIDDFSTPVPSSCETALTKLIECDNLVENFARLELRTSVGNKTQADSVCDAGCGQSLDAWFKDVEKACKGYTDEEDAPFTLIGGRMYAGYNETCLVDTASKDYCVDIVSDFPTVASIDLMATNHICSYCYTTLRSMMQKSSYSYYDSSFQKDLTYINTRCQKTFNTTIPPSLVPDDSTPPCDKDRVYVTVSGDTCDSIAQKKSVSSAAIYMGNPFTTPDCKSFAPGTQLCLPPPCALIHNLKKNDTCATIESAYSKDYNITFRDIERYNPWIDIGCGNMWNASENAYGHVICLAPQNGQHTLPGDRTGREVGQKSNGYATKMVEVPQNVILAQGTTQRCGVWYTAQQSDTCLLMTFKGPTTIDILMKVNPALGSDASKCSDLLKPGLTYCVFPMYNWDYNAADDVATTVTILDPTSTTRSTTTTTSAVPTNLFSLKSRYYTDCSGAVYNDISLKSGSTGTCINTNCQASCLQIAAEGLCPDGQVQVSYWEKPGCTGKWFGYDYTSRGTNFGLWSWGLKYQALHVRCAAKKDDCVSLKTCTYDPAPDKNLCPLE